MSWLSNWRTRQALVAYGILLPAIAYFAVYFFYPIVIEFWASFYKGMPLIGEARFAGFENYVAALTDARVQQSLVTTLIYAVSTTVLTLLIALSLAAILAGPVRANNLIRAVIFFPYIISFVIVALMWKSILDPYTGILNSFLYSVGLPGQDWLASPKTALATMIGITVWKDVGYAMLIYIAAIQGIPQNLYEAAALDGANPRQLFRTITVPLLAPTTLSPRRTCSPRGAPPTPRASTASTSTRRRSSSSISAMRRRCPSSCSSSSSSSPSSSSASSAAR
jgi:multiple sugar transport system permease protein